MYADNLLRQSSMNPAFMSVITVSDFLKLFLSDGRIIMFLDMFTMPSWHTFYMLF